MFGGVGGAPVMFGGVGGGMCGYCRLDVGPPPGRPAAPRTSTVRSAAEPEPSLGAGTCRVVVVDTGLAADPFLPDAVQAQSVGDGERDEPDADDDGNLDAATGHGTFIAAIIEQLAPGATVEVRQVLSTFGDGSDSEVGDALWALVDDPPEVVNLSFAGYSDNDAAPLAIRDAIAQLVAGGTAVVAAAGNDATCRAAWPASLDGVVGVGALGPGGPAWFTNHGPWVRACAPGVDVVSRFFRVPTQLTATHEPDVQALGEIVEWATWSGTSFAAPIVAGVLARAVLAGWAPAQAVARTIDNPSLIRLAGLGTVLNERPW
jgi:subtilisin family serine protease